jgi:hypothetical protein
MVRFLKYQIFLCLNFNSQMQAPKSHFDLENQHEEPRRLKYFFWLIDFVIVELI